MWRFVVTEPAGGAGYGRAIAPDLAVLRRRPVPHRVVDGHVIVARPKTGDVVDLDGVAAVVWLALDEPLDLDGLVRSIDLAFPDVPPADCKGAVLDSLRLLDDADLIERTPS